MELGEATDLVLASIQELNLSMDADEQIEPAADTVLFGSGGALDSLGLVELILVVEEKVQMKLGISVSLADDRAMSQDHSPFRSVRTLSEYLCSLIKDRSDGST